jgi:predicted dehydrogenase
MPVAFIKESRMFGSASRRAFIGTVGLGGAALAMPASTQSVPQKIQGFEEEAPDPNLSKGWKRVGDRRIRVGIVGFGYCTFGARFFFQDHPNVEVVAVSDLLPDRCAGLAKACRCAKTYPSLEELVKDDKIEAVFVATDAPGHARHCIDVLKHGKHVACAVPAVWGSIEDADRLLEAVKTSGRKYMMFETSCYHADLYAMRQTYRAGGLGKLVYTEGEYYHYMPQPLPSYKGWRAGAPPLWYPTHATAYYVGVTEGSFTHVSCMGMKSRLPVLQPGANAYNNPFGTEVALFRTSEGGMARMTMSKDTPGKGGEMGRIRGEKGSFYERYEGQDKKLPDLARPPLPPGVGGGGHGGSHGFLANEFVLSILEDRKPYVDVAMALNMSVCGTVAHQSALKDGELMKIPQYRL